MERAPRVLLVIALQLNLGVMLPHHSAGSSVIASDAEFNRFSISVNDLEKARDYAEEAHRQPSDSVAHEALAFCAIVAYYRPFSPNEKKGAATATASLDIGALLPLSATELTLHEQCKLLRNKALAHSEQEFNPTKINANRDIVQSKPFSLLVHPIDLVALLALISKVHGACELARAEYMLAPRRRRAPAT